MRVFPNEKFHAPPGSGPRVMVLTLDGGRWSIRHLHLSRLGIEPSLGAGITDLVCELPAPKGSEHTCAACAAASFREATACTYR